MMKKKKTLEEKIITVLGEIFAMLLFVTPFVLIFFYGILHATTLN